MDTASFVIINWKTIKPWQIKVESTEKYDASESIMQILCAHTFFASFCEKLLIFRIQRKSFVIY